WRPCVSPDGECCILLAMRWELVGQIGQELPGVTDQASLTNLGTRFGVLERDPSVTTKLSGGQKRLAVLSLELTHEMIEDPADNSEEGPFRDVVTGDDVSPGRNSDEKRSREGDSDEKNPHVRARNGSKEFLSDACAHA